MNDTVINDTTSGIISYGPVVVTNSRFISNGVCISVKDDDLLQVNNATFETYDHWGIMVKTWDEGISYYDHNTFNGGEDAFGDIAFYGIVDIEVVGPMGITVKGAEIWVRSPFGTSERMGQGELEVVWGYLEGGRMIEDLDYTANSSWTPAEGSTEFRMEQGLSVDVFLPLVDVWVQSIEVKDDNALVRLTVNGTDTNAVELWVYIDGAYSHEMTTDLTTGTDVYLKIDLSNISTGEHTISVEAYSYDEWDGNDRVLLDNNNVAGSFNVREDTGDELLLIYFLVAGAIMLFIIPILIRKKR